MLSRSLTIKRELLECRGIYKSMFVFFNNRPSVHVTAAITKMPVKHCYEVVQGNGYLCKTLSCNEL